MTSEQKQADIDAAGSLQVTLILNGSARSMRLEPRVTLLDALREYAGLTGTKKGCDHGQCGACTVLIDGRRINSCLTLAVMQAGKQITTVEGLAEGGALQRHDRRRVSRIHLQRCRDLPSTVRRKRRHRYGVGGLSFGFEVKWHHAFQN